MALVGGEGSNFMWRKKVTAAKLGVHGNDKTEKNHLAVVGKQPPPPLYAVSHGYGGRGDLALGLLQLVGKGKLGRLLLQLGELVLVLGDLLQGGLDELALHVTDRDGELVDLEVAEDDLALQEEHLSLGCTTCRSTAGRSSSGRPWRRRQGRPWCRTSRRSPRASPRPSSPAPSSAPRRPSS